MKRFRITTWVVSLVLAFGVSLAGTIASAGATTLARTSNAPAKSAKKKPKKHKTSCPKGAKKQGKLCIETKTVTNTVTEPGKTVEVPNNKGQEEERAKKEAAEKAKTEAEGKAAAEKAKAEAEAAGKTKAEAEAAAQKAKVEAEAAAKKKAEEEANTQKTAKEKAEAELKAKVEAEAAAKKKKEEEEAKLKLEEAARHPELGVGPAETGGTKAIEKESEIPLAPAWTPEQLNAEPSGNWITSEGGTTGDHDSTLSEITPSNASQLKADWMTELNHSAEASKFSGEADLVVYEGVGYYATGADDVFAISIASGKILWEHKGELPETVADVCCGWDNRGVTIGEGKVFSAVLNGSVEALNQQTGKLEWRSELGEPAEGFTVTSAPLYYEGMIFIGPVGAEYGVRGFMEAFSAKTGALIWKHYNIPAPGEFGHETWPTGSTCKECDNEWEHGGATTWNAPTVDPRDGDIYYSTANAGGGGIGGGKNGGDSGGDTREGADLWTVSVLALNYKTGELAWGYQLVHHDIWDYDQSTQPTMVNVETGGKKVEGIVAANKDGFAYFLNAATGEPVFPIEEAAVPQNKKLMATYPTQPIPKMPPFNPPKADAEELKLLNEKLAASAAALSVPKPTINTGVGYAGGDVFAPPSEFGEATINESRGSTGAHVDDESYSPETGDYYVCSHFSPEVVSVQSELTNPTGGETFGTGKTGLSDSVAKNEARGYVTAYSMKTGQIIWADERVHSCYAEGTAVTKGGVLFSGSPEGMIIAYNAATGAELWKFDIGAAPGMISVYEYGGKERVSIYGGGNDDEGSKHGDYLWQFSLNGTGPAQKECVECDGNKPQTEKHPWPPAGSTFPYGPVL